jgi:biopolymer transport protein ExbD
MKTLVIALLVAGGCGGCKEKQAPAKQEAPAERDRQQPGPRPELETPSVTGPGLVPAAGLGPKITFSKTDIKLDGESIAPLARDGFIEPTRVQALTRLLESKATSDAPVAITLDANVPYRNVGRLLDTLKRAGFRNLALLTGNGSQMIPIELPDSDEINGAGLRPVVTLDGTDVKRWSASGQEGTRAKPKLSTTIAPGASFAPLTRALADIVQKRWPLHERGDADRTIIIQVDGSVPAERVLQVLAAVRADGALELFPNIFLAGGG